MLKYVQNRRGQGTTEYIVIIAIIVIVLVTVFKSGLVGAISAKIGTIVNSISNA